MTALIFALVYFISTIGYTVILGSIMADVTNSTEFNGCVMGSVFIIWAPVAAFAVTGVIWLFKNIFKHKQIDINSLHSGG